MTAVWGGQNACTSILLISIIRGGSDYENFCYYALASFKVYNTIGFLLFQDLFAEKLDGWM